MNYEIQEFLENDLPENIRQIIIQGFNIDKTYYKNSLYLIAESLDMKHKALVLFCFEHKPMNLIEYSVSFYGLSNYRFILDDDFEDTPYFIENAKMVGILRRFTETRYVEKEIEIWK